MYLRVVHEGLLAAGDARAQAVDEGGRAPARLGRRQRLDHVRRDRRQRFWREEEYIHITVDIGYCDSRLVTEVGCCDYFANLKLYSLVGHYVRVLLSALFSDIVTILTRSRGSHNILYLLQLQLYLVLELHRDK